MKLEELLINNPVVAAIKNDEQLESALNSSVHIVFVLYGNILNIKDICEKLKNKGKLVFVHVDMIDGLKGDSKGIEFIKHYADPYGIISTRPSNIKYGKQLGLSTIIRVFAIDSLSLDTGIKNVHTVMPDAVEVMPGIASKIIRAMEKEVHLPIIAGGLIQTKKDIMDSLSAGAVAISTTAISLWDIS
ncbi:glycerol-3-phosphate responsive antiterminator [Candidatus Clostridium radicumherbarum]|uniref:Glycerol-3-phosphate responsive antiterminator n=1 Tax=Candidatus Clostridium radicumherbarum TaxID=3381662 RepID=A0ABW8TTE6_9CLOT